MMPCDGVIALHDARRWLHAGKAAHLLCTSAECRYRLCGMMTAPTMPTATVTYCFGSFGISSRSAMWLADGFTSLEEREIEKPIKSLVPDVHDSSSGTPMAVCTMNLGLKISQRCFRIPTRTCSQRRPP